MPLCNFFGWWDANLSGALYSGNTPDARVYVSQEVYTCLSPVAKTSTVRRVDATPDDLCPYEVHFPYWAMAAMKVPHYPADRVAYGLARCLAELPEQSTAASPQSPLVQEDGSVRVILILRGRAHWRTGERQEKCLVL